MKILVTGRAIPKQPDRCTGQQLAEGFRQAGHDCIFYGNFFGEPYRWLGAQEATTESFDLVVVTEMNDEYPNYSLLFDYLNLKGTPRLYWDFDVSYHPDISYEWARDIDYDGYLVGNRYFCGSDGFGRFRKPVLHLPYACSPQIHRRKPEILKQSIIGFIGSMTPERKQLLANVRCIEGVFGEALIDATNELYIMVHVNQGACRGLVPGRPWETAGCGTTLLMDHASYEDFKEFVPDELDDAVRVFNDIEDVNRYAIDHYDSRETLKELGRKLMEHMHHNHSYKNRAERIVEWIKEQKILS